MLEKIGEIVKTEGAGADALDKTKVIDNPVGTGANAFAGGPSGVTDLGAVLAMASSDKPLDTELALQNEKSEELKSDVVTEAESILTKPAIEEEEEEFIEVSETETETEIDTDNDTDTEISETYTDKQVVTSIPRMQGIVSEIETPDVAPTTNTIASNSSYAEAIEGFATVACQRNNVRNVELAAYGMMAMTATYSNLNVIEFGEHKFIGVPYTDKEEVVIALKISLFIEASNKQMNVIKATQKLRDSTVDSYTLVITESIIQKLVDTFNYKVKVNYKTVDAKDLCIVIERV